MRLPPEHEKRLAELRDLSKVYAKAKGRREYLEHYRKTKLAQLASHEFSTGKISHAAAETKARTDSGYIEVLKGIEEAVEASEGAYWELRIAMAGMELLRSTMAHERAEMNLT